MEIKLLELELTSKCNLKCKMCYRGELTKQHKNKDLDLSVFNNMDMDKLNLIDICGNLGDGMCHSDLFSFIDIVHPKTQIKFATNGSIHSEQWWSELAGKFSKNEKSYIIFAMDGLEDTHSKYRVGSNFQKLVKNIKAFNSNGGRSCLQLILFKHNQHQREDVKAFSQELGCLAFVTRTSSAYDEEFERPEPPKVENTKTLPGQPPKKLEKQPAVFKTRHETCEEAKGKELRCKHLANGSVYIDFEGDVFPCCHTASIKFKQYPGIYDAYIKHKHDINLKDRHMNEIIESDFFKHIHENYNDIERCQSFCRFHPNKFVMVE